MKNLILGCSTLLLVLTSCSKSSDDPAVAPVVTPPTSSAILLKKFIVTPAGSTTGITTDITYNGNKIVKSVSSDGTSKVFTYTGDLITKIEEFVGLILDSSVTLSYNANGKLETYVELIYDSPTIGMGTKETYSYRTATTMTYTNKSGDLATQNFLEFNATATFTNGEIIKIEKVTGSFTTPAVVNYTYDSKNNPFKNVTGYAAISFIDSEPTGFVLNVLTRIEPANTFGNELNTYTYDSNNYPLTQSKVYSFRTFNTQYFY